jgi:predicted AAA+ superfamily ATPase
MQYHRYLKDSILQAFKVSPVVLLIGPRQSGKTTLIKELGKDRDIDYITKSAVMPLDLSMGI